MRPRHYLFALVDAGGNVTPELHAVQRLIERRHAHEDHSMMARVDVV